MEIKVRIPNLENMTAEGIPKDFADVMDYFNNSLKENSLPWIPRKNPITTKEIKEKWIPSLNTNISLVAELNGKVVGSGTVFYDPNSTAYEDANQMISGEFNSTANPKMQYVKITQELIKGISRELKEKGKIAHCHLPIESPAIQAMQELGIKGKETTLEHYQKQGLSGKVIKYELP